MGEDAWATDIEFLARRFHEVYESWAPSFGWSTQKSSRTEWEDLPPNQRALMLTVVREVVVSTLRERDNLRAMVSVEQGDRLTAEEKWQGAERRCVALARAANRYSLALNDILAAPFDGGIQDYEDWVSHRASTALRGMDWDPQAGVPPVPGRHAVVCGDCGKELIPRKPGPGGGDLWERHECSLEDVLDYVARMDEDRD